jgi:hypothetical protein
MNCQRFEELVNDIAREQMLDVSVRREALAHSSECKQCGLRLEDEHAITLRLRNFASGFGSVGAPARLETQLLAAFGERALVNSQPQPMSRKAYWIAAIAALFVIVFALSIFRPWQSAPAAGTNAVPVAQAGSSTSLVAPPLVPDTGQVEQKRLSVPRPRTLAARQNRRATSITKQAKTAGPTEPKAEIEVATDFLPVTYGGMANLADGGRMVRVQLPRSAMASFGLPVNMDRANEWVKADVLVGVDGLAHAIRFVR